MCRLLLICWLAAVSAAWAIPTLYGPTGLVALPDACVATGWALAGDVVDTPNQRGVHLRAVRGMPGGEVGVTLISDDDTRWGAHGKVQLWQEPRVGEIALGGVWLEGDIVDTGQLYLAMTSPPVLGTVSGTVGVTWTRVSTAAGATSGVRPYVGARLQLPEGLLLVAEYQAKSDDLMEPSPLSSVMLVRPLGRYLTSSVGVTNAVAQLGSDEHRLFAGVTLVFAP